MGRTGRDEIEVKLPMRPEAEPEDQDEELDVVDERDEIVGSAGRDEIHRRGLLHRSVHVFLVDGAGRLYLQKRAPWKKEHPLRWDSSASGHVLRGETYEAAACRELAEELGIDASVTRVLSVPASPRTGWEHSALFLVRDSAGVLYPVPNPQEIVEGRFFTEGEIEELLCHGCDAVSPAFSLLYDLWKKRAGQLSGPEAGANEKGRPG